MLQHNDLQTCQKVIEQLTSLAPDVFARCRGKEFFDSKINGVEVNTTSKFQTMTKPSMKDKIKNIPIIGPVAVKTNDCLKYIKKNLTVNKKQK